MDVREGRWMEYLDGETGPEERAEMERRLSADPSESELLHELRERRRFVKDLLGRAAVDTPDPADFRERVKAEAHRRRGDGAGTGRAGGGWPWHGLPARAAAVALLLVGAGGAAAAIPGSPVRGWLSDLRDGGAAAPTAEAGVAVSESTPEDSDEVGVRVQPADGRLTVSLEGVPDRSEVRVRLVDGDRAAVYAPRGTRFRTSDGRVQATVAGGPVRIEIPHSLSEAVVRVDGRIFLEKRGSSVETPGPTVAPPEDGERNVAGGDILFRTR